jgi:hypothetical protein
MFRIHECYQVIYLSDWQTNLRCNLMIFESLKEGY